MDVLTTIALPPPLLHIAGFQDNKPGPDLGMNHMGLDPHFRGPRGHKNYTTHSLYPKNVTKVT